MSEGIVTERLLFSNSAECVCKALSPMIRGHRSVATQVAPGVTHVV